MSKLNEIFITGSTGIAGGFAVEEINQRGFSLKLLMRKIPSTTVSSALNYVQGDLNQLMLLDQLSRNNSGIVHYACASLRGNADPQVDIDAMKILLNNWENGSFTFISSVDVYGYQRQDKIIDELCPLSGEMNAYSAGKIACETLLIEEAKRRGRNDFTIFRAPWIFAPNTKSKQHIINRFIKIFDNKILLPGKTKEEYEKYVDCWIDARDLAWLVAESIEKPLGGAGNAIGGEFCWHDFFKELLIISNLNIPIIHTSLEESGEYAAELFGQYNHFSGSKIAQYFQFNPRHQLNETLRAAFSLE
jgi:nucleoside-diphosphate-sugar epimerase